jgi:hypothetical protein
MMRIQQADRKMFELGIAIPTAISHNFSSEKGTSSFRTST